MALVIAWRTKLIDGSQSPLFSGL